MNIKTKKIVLPILVIVLLGLGGIGFLNYNKNPNKLPNKNLKTPDKTSVLVQSSNILLKNYPIDTVPLIDATKIESAKYFVNDDPNTSSSYFGSPINYYNIVFNTNTSPTELFSKYKNLMNEKNDKESTNNKIIGKIGKYKVSIAHYGGTTKSVYIQVYLPKEEYSKINPYYNNYPKAVLIGDSFIEHENSYGKLNQREGQEEYTKYFVIDSTKINIKEQKITNYYEYFYDLYKNKYKDKKNFKSDDSKKMLIWSEDSANIFLTFEETHKRVYLMIQKNL